MAQLRDEQIPKQKNTWVHGEGGIYGALSVCPLVCAVLGKGLLRPCCVMGTAMILGMQ